MKTKESCHVKYILNLYVIKQDSAKDHYNLLDNADKNLRALKVLKFDRHIP